MDRHLRLRGRNLCRTRRYRTALRQCMDLIHSAHQKYARRKGSNTAAHPGTALFSRHAHIIFPFDVKLRSKCS